MKHPASTLVRFGVACAASALGFGLLVPATASACNVPVFRYALERWRPDPYRITLFKRGILTEAQQQLLSRLDDLSGTTPANVSVRIVDVGEKNADSIEDEADRKLFAASGSTELPHLVVQYPESLRNDKPIARGPLTDETVSRTLASPLRTELVRRLAAGQTAVWLLLECGDAAKDEAAAKQLASELESLSKSLELPELSDAPEDNLLSSAPLGITFSLLRVSRTTAAERSLVDALLASEEDLLQFNDPMIFPVFGRGRALLPLVGAGITTDNIQNSAGFLIGACSCEVKDLNPGFDLLLAADWEKLLFQTPETAAAAELVAAKTAAPAGPPQLVAIPAGAASLAPTAAPAPPATRSSQQEAEPRRSIPGTPWMWGGVAALAIVCLSAVALRRRS